MPLLGELISREMTGERGPLPERGWENAVGLLGWWERGEERLGGESALL